VAHNRGPMGCLGGLSNDLLLHVGHSPADRPGDLFHQPVQVGLILLSIGEEEEAAAHIGINVTRYRILFLLELFFMGHGGSRHGDQWAYIDPESPSILCSLLHRSLWPVRWCGQYVRSILGAGILTLASEILLSRFPITTCCCNGILFIVIISFLPDGLVGLTRRWRKASVMS